MIPTQLADSVLSAVNADRLVETAMALVEVPSPTCQAREVLAVPVAQPPQEPAGSDSAHQHLCPLCSQGRMLLIETFQPLRPAAVILFDSS